jgi:hypothetical protein
MGATDIGHLWKDPDGVLYHLSRTRFADIRDGLSSTIVLAETRDVGAAAWIEGTAAAIAGKRYDGQNSPSYAGPEISINYFPYYQVERNTDGSKQYDSIDCLFGPSSLHAGGAYHLFGDGSVHFLSQYMNAGTYQALCSRNGNEAVSF